MPGKDLMFVWAVACSQDACWFKRLCVMLPATVPNDLDAVLSLQHV